MSCKDYIDLKPGMEVLITEPWFGFTAKKATVKNIEAWYTKDNVKINYSLVFDVDGKECSITSSSISSIIIEPCKKVYVKDLRVGDVVKHGVQRGIVKYKNTYEIVIILWIGKGSNDHYSVAYSDTLENVEIVGHVDLWNL